MTNAMWYPGWDSKEKKENIIPVQGTQVQFLVTGPACLEVQPNKEKKNKLGELTARL